MVAKQILYPVFNLKVSLQTHSRSGIFESTNPLGVVWLLPHWQLVQVSFNASQHLHTLPINAVVYDNPLGRLKRQGKLISRLASRLDAFSGYRFRT